MKKLLKNFEEVLAAAIMLFMTLLTFINVIFRYCFSQSLSITDELTTCFFVLLSLLGAAIAAKRGAHLGLNVVTDLFPQKTKKYFTFFGALLSVIFCLILVFYGAIMVYQEYTMGLLTSGLQLPEWIFGSFIPLGGAVLCYRFAEYGIKELMKKEEN